jgi:hypothetical protein
VVPACVRVAAVGGSGIPGIAGPAGTPVGAGGGLSGIQEHARGKGNTFGTFKQQTAEELAMVRKKFTFINANNGQRVNPIFCFTER